MDSPMRSPATTAQQALASFLKQPAETISYTVLTGGSDEGTVIKCVHQDTKYVVKLFKNPASCKHESSWTQHASTLGIGPHFYDSDQSQYIIMGLVEGKSLVPDTANSPAILKSLAASVRVLHHSSAPFAQISEMFPRIEEKYKKLKLSGELGNLLENLLNYIKQVEKQINEVSVPLVPCQNDLNPRNVFVQDSKVTIIDWGDAALGNPFYDIAAFFVLNLIGRPQERYFLEHYNPQLLQPEWQRYLHACKHIVNFEFALNVLSGVQALNPAMLHAQHIQQGNTLKYYLTLFAEQKVEMDAAFLYGMAVASLKEITY